MRENENGGFSPAFVAALLNLARDGVLLADTHRRIILSNARARQLLRRCHADLLGLAVDELFPGRVPRLRELPEAGDTTPESRYHLQWLHRDGAIVPLDIAVSRVPGGGDIELAILIRDAWEESQVSRPTSTARYDAFLLQIARSIAGTADDRDGMGAMPALIASALDLRAVAIIVIPATGDTRVYSCSFPDNVMRAALGSFASQAKHPGEGATTLKEMDERHEPFVLALAEAEFHDAVVLGFHQRDRERGVVVALSRIADRFDAGAQEFLGHVRNLLRGAMRALD